MKISECAQEQLEQLWIIEEEGAQRPETFEQTPENYQELLMLGLVGEKNNVYQLTENGRREAAQAIRRHRLAERLMVDILTTEEDLVDERACSLEHALMDGIDESICTLLGHPRLCPHGKPIPPGRCCHQHRHAVGPLIAPLSNLKTGQHGRIAYVQMVSPQHLQKLMAMGVLPGASLRVKSNYPSIVFEVGYSQFAVDEEIANSIYVRLNSDEES